MPWWGWLLVGGLAAMLGIAYGYAINGPVGWVMFGVVAGLGAWGLVHLAIEVSVAAEGLRVGPVFLEAQYLGPAVALDHRAAVQLRGQGADARAFVVLRAWVGPAVRVDVADRRDPTPYWFVSTRQPTRLVAAIDHAAGWSSRQQPPAPATTEEEPA